jgi:hypothetical protein
MSDKQKLGWVDVAFWAIRLAVFAGLTAGILWMFVASGKELSVELVIAVVVSVGSVVGLNVAAVKAKQRGDGDNGSSAAVLLLMAGIAASIQVQDVDSFDAASIDDSKVVVIGNLE